MDVKYILRAPKFPIIINLDGHVIAATPQSLPKQLSQFELGVDGSYDVIDQSGEGFGLYVYEDSFAISPLVVKKKWTKMELIQLYNGRKNKADEPAYSEKSLSAKKVDRIISDLSGLLMGVT